MRGRSSLLALRRMKSSEDRVEVTKSPSSTLYVFRGSYDAFVAQPDGSNGMRVYLNQ